MDVLNMDHVWLSGVGIGIVTGLRSMTAPAAVSWAAHLGWLHLQGSPLAFVGSTAAVAIFSLLAVSEYVIDKLPRTPRRTAPVGFTARIIVGTLCGACVGVSAGQPLISGALLGVVGAILGTLGGYQARTRLVKALKVKDLSVAIAEDLVAIGLAVFVVSIR
jgi:uncharacterized membrane protein